MKKTATKFERSAGKITGLAFYVPVLSTTSTMMIRQDSGTQQLRQLPRKIPHLMSPRGKTVLLKNADFRRPGSENSTNRPLNLNSRSDLGYMLRDSGFQFRYENRDPATGAVAGCYGHRKPGAETASPAEHPPMLETYFVADEKGYRVYKKDVARKMYEAGTANFPPPCLREIM